MPEDDAVKWKGLKIYAPHAKAATRLELVKRFPHGARGWAEELQRPEPLKTIELIHDIDRFFTEQQKPNEQKKRILDAEVYSVWTNRPGLVGIKMASREVVDLLMIYVDSVLAGPISPKVALALDGMDEVVRQKTPGRDQIANFKQVYQFMIDVLEALDETAKTPDILALICQYHGWVAHLTAWAHETEEDDGPLIKAIGKASASSRVLRSALDQLTMKSAVPLSPFHSLYAFQRLSNEIQLESIRVTVEPDHKASLEKKLKREEYFEQAVRVNELWPWRTIEMMHALRAASAIGDHDQMVDFGYRALKAVKRVLAIYYRPDPVPLNSPIFEFKQPLFKGDPSPDTLDGLESYLQTEHNEALERFRREEDSNPDEEIEEAVPDGIA